VDGEGLIVGIVSQGDLLPKEAYRDRVPTRREVLLHLEEIEKAGGTTAGDIMTVPVAVIGPHATLSEAARLMARRHVHRLPVVDGRERLLGIISRGDLLKVFLVSDEQLAATVLVELAEAMPGTDISRLTVSVEGGRAVIGGALDDNAKVPVLARVARAVEGVVDVEVRLDHPRRGVEPPPDFQALY
jgi:predicted transcriptional regulator